MPAKFERVAWRVLTVFHFSRQRARDPDVRRLWHASIATAPERVSAKVINRYPRQSLCLFFWAKARTFGLTRPLACDMARSAASSNWAKRSQTEENTTLAGRLAGKSLRRSMYFPRYDIGPRPR
jgi:hypothetical protein